MKFDAIGRDQADISALSRSARLSIARTAHKAFAGVIACCVLATVAAALAAGMREPLTLLVTAAAVALVGCVAALVATRWLSSLIGRGLVRLIELILSQLSLTGEGTPALHCQSGRALSRAEIEDDLKVLSRHMRGVEHQSRAIIAELAHARDEANQQNLAQSHFVANMSHELRTPLNAILGYAMLLQDDASEAGDDAVVADLERIQIAGRNLLALINDILDLSKIEAGKTTLERSLIDIEALTRQIAQSCASDADRNGNDFELTIASDAGIMVGDAAKVRQCLTNLLSNAFKFTRNGKVSLTIEPVSFGGRPSVRFSVADSGIGIDPTHLERLFEAFQQVDNSPSRQFSGTGLGLAITRRLARMMGGDCSVVSKKGKGSTFHLTLPLSPLAETGARPDAAERTPAPAPAPAPVRGKRAAERTALIVDDDEAAIDLLQRWLGRMGYDALTTTDGEAGLALARTYRPDIILLDALLPGRSGYELLVELRDDAAIHDIPVIMITVDDDRARGLESGASDYLRKPVAEEQLREAMEVYRGRASGDVLVIDDDDDAAALVRRTVEQLGFSTRRAADGLQGVCMAVEAPPAAIVLDLVMPGMNGFEVIERLAADETLKRVPLVVLSSCEITLSQHRQLAAAGHRFFAKGASTPREIAQSLKEMVG